MSQFDILSKESTDRLVVEMSLEEMGHISLALYYYVKHNSLYGSSDRAKRVQAKWDRRYKAIHALDGQIVGYVRRNDSE